jgi:protein-disulfide isomerase
LSCRLAEAVTSSHPNPEPKSGYRAKEIKVSPQKKPAKTSSLTKFYWIFGAVILVSVGAIAYAKFKSTDTQGAVDKPITLADSSDARSIYQRATPMQLGNADAPVKLVVFSDYQCPYCGQWASQVQSALVNDFVKTGKLQFVYYDFPLGGAHKYSYHAARAARCAGDQNKFWEYHDALFGHQTDWSSRSGVPIDDFTKYADEVGVKRDQFDTCLKSDKYADVVSANRLLGDQLGVNATPTILINNRRVREPLDYKEIKDMIAKEGGV